MNNCDFYGKIENVFIVQMLTLSWLDRMIDEVDRFRILRPEVRPMGRRDEIGRSWASAIVGFKRAEDASILLAVIDDPDVRAVLFVWGRVPAVYGPPEIREPASSAETWDWAWSGTVFDARMLADAAGLPAARARRAFQKARGMRLIYPDGSVSPAATNGLRAAASAALQKVRGRQPKVDPKTAN